jgi:anti-sigma factor RsiW
MKKERCFTEDVLALFVEGDLPRAKAAAVESHVRECIECESRLSEFRESQSAMKSLFQESVSAAALANVRTSVLDAVARGKKASGWALRLERLVFAGFRRYALAGLAIAVIAGGVVWHSLPSTQAPSKPAPIAATTPAPIPAPVLATAQIAKVQTNTHTPKRVSRRPALRPEPVKTIVQEEPREIVMKIVTDDPNIIIYWLLDQKGAD